ncbi:MAG: universal stress protein [Acidobacteriota bacterium]
MPAEIRRRTPEELLREVQAEEAAAKSGQLKIFLGYASGVGKSFRMLDEARRRKVRGEDVVVGAIQPQVPRDAEVLLQKLEVIPLMTIGSGTAMDVESVIRRHPVVCIIDGLAYDNPPGSRNPTRWRDVQDLLDAGINVIGSVNVQYIAEMQEQVAAITGKHAGTSVPVAFVKSAYEIEIVDTPPEAPIERSPAQQADADRRAQQLSRLRELALVLAANVVDHQLVEYMRRHGLEQRYGTQERILVCITPRANIHEMMETALRIADRFHGELIVAYVDQPNLSQEDRIGLEERLTIARGAGAHIKILEGDDPARAILDFAKTRGVTQLFVGHSQRSGLKTRIWGSPTDKLIQSSRGMDVRVFPQ